MLTLHDLIHLANRDEASLAERAYDERLVRPAVRRAGTVLTVSEISRAEIRQRIRDDDVEVVNVGNRCSELFFQPIQAQRDVSSLLCAGNLKAHKNPRPLLAALAALSAMRLTTVTQLVFPSLREGCEAVAEVVGPHGTKVTDRTDPDEWGQAIMRTVSGELPYQRPADWRARWSWDAVEGCIDATLRGVALR